MKNITTTIFLFFVLNTMLAQADSVPYYNKTLSKNNFSVELGGKALLYSIGYERTLLTSKKVLLTASVNASYLGFLIFNPSVVTIPVGMNVAIGAKKNKLLLGFYTTNNIDFAPYPSTKKERELFKATEDKSNWQKYSPPYRLVFLIPSIGYRRYFKNGHSLSIEYDHIMYNFYGTLYVNGANSRGLFQWMGIKYNFAF